MSRNLRRCMKTMHLYCCTKSKSVKKSILDEMSKENCFFDALYEVINNIHLENFKLKNLVPAQRRKLRKYAEIMHKIHVCPKKKAIRKRLVNQTGGFIQYILPFLVDEIRKIINNAVGKENNTSTT